MFCLVLKGNLHCPNIQRRASSYSYWKLIYNSVQASNVDSVLFSHFILNIFNPWNFMKVIIYSSKTCLKFSLGFLARKSLIRVQYQKLFLGIHDFMSFVHNKYFYHSHGDVFTKWKLVPFTFENIAQLNLSEPSKNSISSSLKDDPETIPWNSSSFTINPFHFCEEEKNPTSHNLNYPISVTNLATWFS